jgi:metal-responsive CopG/Arc/MetJ family transcriptional regulator
MFERARKDYKPPKPKKQRIHFSLPLDLLQAFELYCETHGYKRNELIECILEEFMNKYGTDKKKK